MIPVLGLENGKSGYIPYLDGLRAVSVFIVMLSHFQYSHIIPGGLGVTVFFVISGFIITRVLFSNCKGKVNNLNIISFYIRRFFRLAPALLVFTLCMLLLDFATNKEVNWWEYLAVTIYQHNYAVHIFGLDDQRYFGHMWSLAVEEHFYLLFPLLLILVKFKSSALKFFLSLCILITVWRIGLVYLASDSNFPILSSDHVYRRSDTRFDSILIGVVLAFATIFYDAWFKAVRVRGLMFFLFGVVLTITPNIFGFSPSLQFSMGLSIQALGIALALTALLVSQILAPIRTILSLPWVVWLGKISYSLYIWHVAVYWRLINPLNLSNDIAKLVLGIVSSIAIAALSYYLIETPLRKWGANLTDKMKTQPLYLKGNAVR